jgi:hypothetical protein
MKKLTAIFVFPFFTFPVVPPQGTRATIASEEDWS